MAGIINSDKANDADFPSCSLTMSSIGLDNKKLATLTAAIGLSGAAIFYSLYTKPKHKFPPGPPRDPIIGNVRNFPLTDWYPNFTKFHDKYGM